MKVERSQWHDLAMKTNIIEPPEAALKSAQADAASWKADAAGLHLENVRLRGENDLLQEIIDSRPAINAGLPDSYIRW